ncbi:cyclomaltodextrinase [Candidatus Phycosocius bacilliformis]|uniref:Cyclomaltodextrinase n=1 Tax=Candidatus Phycosocius bacilliformis TaxID=1445552 RepID=A0A2P2E9E6_9PROT|nr:alpha-amylase family glycosyl hydrolase [Candidatus Phycosocius bacilliformis]GBF57654.1 cyclomaltodextrinase [Candidatus Phycosocius bacilliformis]
MRIRHKLWALVASPCLCLGFLTATPAAAQSTTPAVKADPTHLPSRQKERPTVTSAFSYANPHDLALAPRLAAREADWRIGPVVYQVMVDRFAPSRNLDAKRHLYAAPRSLQPWDKAPTRGHLLLEQGLWTHEIEFWGGDIDSLGTKLDYIKDLDIDVLYLGPIHDAFTNHKYDANDYFKVSPEYGTREDVKALAKDVHAKGMKLVLDGVLNHMGRNSPQFQDALKRPDSPWRDWYFIGPEYKLGYRAWWDVANLPDVNWENPAVRARLYGDADSVIQGWLRDGIDGWRLDVAYDIGFRFLGEATKAAHQAKPGALMLGEIYNYPEQWLGPMDAMLNITAGEVIYELVDGKVSGPQAGNILERMVQDSDYDGLLRSWIVLDNHDRPRLANRLPDPAARRMAQILQFTLPGAPNLYYGVEIGLEGADDPMNRAPMDWTKANDRQPEFVWIRQLTGLRKEMRALRIGEFRRLDAEKLLAFTRYTDRVGELAVVLVNPTDQPVSEFMSVRDSKLMNNEPLRDVFTGYETRVRAGLIRVELPAHSAMVLRPVLQHPEKDYTAYKRVQ